MADLTHPIFRAEAVQRYIQGKEKVVLPQLVSPRLFAYLWAVCALLAASVCAGWFAQIPTYDSGPGVVVDRGGPSGMAHSAIMVAAFLPEDARALVRSGEGVLLDIGGERLSQQVIAVDGTVSSPSAVRERFGLDAGAAQVVTGPAIVVLVRVDPASLSLPPSVYIGSICHVEVEVGARRLITLFPLVGPLLGA